MKNHPRRQVLIDRKVQGTLILRVAIYWLMMMSGIFCLLAGFPLVTSVFVRSPRAPTSGQIILQTWRIFWPVLFASGLTLPIFMLDVVRVSHRFVGPLFRLRSGLRDLADGKPVRPMKFRKDDFWFEVAEEFNRAAARTSQANDNTSPPRTGSRRIAETVVEDTCPV